MRDWLGYDSYLGVVLLLVRAVTVAALVILVVRYV